MKTLANRVKGGQCQSWNKVEGIQIPWLCFKRKGLNLGRKQTIFFKENSAIDKVSQSYSLCLAHLLVYHVP